MSPPRGLPPLDLLLPFEAAARLGSFTRAAGELNVTQSAVSQRVRTLEDRLGVTLFERAHRTIRLTAEGRALLNGTTAALQHLRAATANLHSAEAEGSIRLATDTSVAAMWLMPRLARFREESSGARIDLTVSDDEASCLKVDVAILHGAGIWPGFDAVRLFSDSVFPVAAPGYLERHPIDTLDELANADLIDLDYQHWNWMNWGIWLTEAGVDPRGSRRAIQSDNYPAVVEAARSGLGIALGWERFVDCDLAEGRLVRVLGRSVSTAFGYFVLVRHGLAPESPARALAEFLATTVD